MEQSFITVGMQILAMVIMLACGYAAQKKKLVDEAGCAQMSNVVLFIALPAIMIRSFAIGFSMQKLYEAGLTFLIGIIVTIFMTIVARLCLPKSRMQQFAAIITNSAYFGIPLVTSFLGTEYVFHLSIINILVIAYSFTVGSVLISGDKSQVSVKKIFTNPTIIATIIGFILFLTSVTLPKLVDTAVTSLANLSSGMAMVIIGASLARQNLADVLRKPENLKFCAVRLVLIPLLVLAGLMFVPNMSLELKLLILTVYSCPAATIVVMFSSLYKLDVIEASNYVASSTLLALITMPLIISLGSYLFTL